MNTNLIQISAEMQNQLKAKNTIALSTQQKVENKNTLHAGNKAQWGFLKNIVNIDTFFASGKDDKKAPEKKTAKKKSRAQTKQSTAQVKLAKSKKVTKSKKQSADVDAEKKVKEKEEEEKT